MNVDLKNVLKAFAPSIAGAIAGPYAPLVSAGIAAVSNAVLGTPGGTVEDVRSAVANGLTPEAVVKLQEADRNFKLEMKKLNTRDREIDLDNTKDARSMQRENNKEGDQFVKRFLYIYSYILTGTALIYIFAITFFPIPKDNVRFADTIIGFLLGTLISTIINFFFGSSSGSTHKTALLSRILGRKNGTDEGDE